MTAIAATTSRAIATNLKLKPMRFLILLIAADMFFVALHLLHAVGPGPLYSRGIISPQWLAPEVFSFWRLSLESDGGFAEMSQYAKTSCILILLFGLFRGGLGKAYLFWALMFGFVLADDIFQIHENLGAWIAAVLHYPAVWKLEPKDLGEITVMSSVGLCFVLWLAPAYRSSTATTKRSCRNLAILLLLLGSFAGIADMIHAAFHSSWAANTLLSLVEDGGEMLVMSTTLWYVCLLAHAGRDAVVCLLADSTHPDPLPGTSSASYRRL